MLDREDWKGVESLIKTSEQSNSSVNRLYSVGSVVEEGTSGCGGEVGE